jgi:hypothetical protein
MEKEVLAFMIGGVKMHDGIEAENSRRRRVAME